MISIAISVFAGAFLLFQVQPLIVRYILPWFGGGPAVWTTAMVFFQVLLVAGYAYAHASRSMFGPRNQALLHVSLLAVAMFMLPIVPSEGFKPDSPERPALHILVLLLATVGLPYFLLASTSPLMQSWASVTRRTRTPYRLYSLSNIASLLALLSYPFVVEPILGRRAQALYWSWAFLAFAVASAWVAIRQWRVSAMEGLSMTRAVTQSIRVTPLERVLWIGLPAAASILLLAVTNEISQDVAAIPFLWILPLSLYLLTFIIAFDRGEWYRRSIVLPLLIPAVIGMVWMMFEAGTTSVNVQLVLFNAGFFVCAMVCHGEVARLKPHPARLTEYFIFVACGGALGGVFVGLAAPILFATFIELHVGITLCVALVLIILMTDAQSPVRGFRPRVVWVLFALGYAALSYGLSRHVALVFNMSVATTRNFYGVLTVMRRHQGSPDETLTLRNGMIDHGMQFTDTSRSRLPITYYGPESGIGVTFRAYQRRTGRRIGLVGLGIGTVAAYAHRGDTLSVFELNPRVTELATTWFSYLSESEAEIEIVHGDARTSLERVPNQRFDVLVLDAFSGDAIPVHLMTEQAFRTYRRHLAPDGILAVHLSNRHLDLEPVLRQHGRATNLRAIMVRNVAGANEVWRSDWMIMTDNDEFLKQAGLQDVPEPATGREPRPWTDDYVNLFAVLRASP